MQGNPVRIAAIAASICLALGLARSAAALEGPKIADDPFGFWIVAEQGPPVSDGLASIPILGLVVRGQIGNPRGVWEIRQVGDSISIEILTRDLKFSNVARNAGHLSSALPDPSSSGGKITVDVTVSDGRLTGRLSYPNYAFELEGRLPEPVGELRESLSAAQARLAQFDNPYAVPEIEKLRQENIVLIQRIRRVEGELRQRDEAKSQPSALQLSSPQVSIKGLVPDGVSAGSILLKSMPSTKGENWQHIAAGQPLFKIADAAASGWILVADSHGNLGFIRSANLLRATGSSQTHQKVAREIVVSFPPWDSGRTGKRITVSDPGFVSIVGRIRGDGVLKDVRISDSQTVFNADGSFTSVMPVPRQGRMVRIEATYTDGPTAVLEFEVAIGK